MEPSPASLQITYTLDMNSTTDSAQGHKASVADSAADHKELVHGQQQHDVSPAPDTSRGQKLRSHLRRYRNWYLTLFGIIVFLIIFLPIL